MERPSRVQLACVVGILGLSDESAWASVAETEPGQGTGTAQHHHAAGDTHGHPAWKRFWPPVLLTGPCPRGEYMGAPSTALPGAGREEVTQNYKLHIKAPLK